MDTCRYLHPGKTRMLLIGLWTRPARHHRALNVLPAASQSPVDPKSSRAGLHSSSCLDLIAVHASGCGTSQAVCCS